MKVEVEFASLGNTYFEAEYINSGEIVLIKVHGFIGTSFTHLLDDAIRQIFSLNIYKVILDCTDAEGFGTIPHGIMSKAHKEAKKHEGSLVLLDLKFGERGIKGIILTVQLFGDTIWPYFKNTNEAIDYFTRDR